MRLRKNKAGPAVRRHKPRVSSAGAALIAIVVIAAACYAVFGGSLPFKGSPFVLKALFTSNTDLHIPSPVRIAGVEVGSVVSVDRVVGSPDAGLVTMDISPNGLPIHADATVNIRSRIFLEGNFYVDLHPGTPEAPSLHSGSVLPAPNTAGPVQLDRILSALNSDSRANLQTLLRGLGASLNGAPTAAQDASQDPAVRGLTGAQALNLSLKYSAQAFEASSIVNQALLGSQPHDLSGVVSGNERVFRGLGASPSVLGSLITTFNATMATLASRSQALGQTIRVLVPLLQNTNTADTALDASFAPTKAFAHEILPGLGKLDPTIGAALPWLAQSTALASPGELGGLLADLTPAVQQTSRTIGETRQLVSSSDELTRCFLRDIIPTGNATILDPPVGTGERVYQELFQGFVGVAGASQSFDGTGRYVRASAGGGGIRGQSPSVPQNGPLFGNYVLTPLGTRPAWTNQAPPLRRDVPCFRNAAPNLNSAATGAGP
jgi:phospholipid/cholesterol/gamma-HCH transport system substrate-binding protein